MVSRITSTMSFVCFNGCLSRFSFLPFYQQIRTVSNESLSQKSLKNRVQESVSTDEKKHEKIDSHTDQKKNGVTPLEWVAKLRDELEKNKEYKRANRIEMGSKPHGENILEYMDRTYKKTNKFQISDLPLSTEPQIDFLKSRMQKENNEKLTNKLRDKETINVTNVSRKT